ncbi:MAG: RnfABCDGE type electron transport complex subunit C [Oscillospiraceae bacterium]|nr:RnfABCDGE type electron transport complex subunit C [Oscillospiraceae bacterium]
MKRLNGIRLPHKKRTEDKPIKPIPLPTLVRIPMLMHAGTPCTPCVRKGENVTVGQCIGMSGNDQSAPIHASVSGKVSAILDYRTLSGETVPCIEIRPDDEQILSDSCVPPVLETRDDLITAAKASGCVGFSGSGDLTFRKLAAVKKPKMLIVNGAECEQYLSADNRLMIENPEDAVGGIRLIMKLLKIKEARIGIQTDKPFAIRKMNEAIAGEKGITVCPLPPVYPQGAEKVLVYHTCGVVIPADQTAADQDILVLNVSTCAFLYQYAQTGIPLVERVVTVDGDAVGKPCNLRVPVGTPVRELLEYAACHTDRVKTLLCGGPMMGIVLDTEEACVVKQQNGLTALRRTKANIRESACIRCGRCMRACPMNLMPMELNDAYQRKDPAALQAGHVALCMDCGCCSYVCPAHRQLAEKNQLAKLLLQKG